MKACVARKETNALIRRQRRAGEAAGVQGTPALFIGGRKITPQGGGFSIAFLADIANRYFLRDWTLPSEASIARWIEAVEEAKAAQEAERAKVEAAKALAPVKLEAEAEAEVAAPASAVERAVKGEEVTP